MDGKEESPERTEELEDASVDTGTTSEVESGSSDQEQPPDQSGGPRADEGGESGRPTEPEPERGSESGDTNSGEGRTATTVTTVHPSGPDVEPSRPDPEDEPKPRRKGPKFKRHKYHREHSAA